MPNSDGNPYDLEREVPSVQNYQGQESNYMGFCMRGKQNTLQLSGGVQFNGGAGRQVYALSASS
jgi:hypothetical protein